MELYRTNPFFQFLLCNTEIFSLKLSVDMKRLSHGVAPFAEKSIDDKGKKHTQKS